MSDENTLETLFDWVPNPSGRFEALRAAFKASEHAISHQADQFAVREQATRRRQGTSGQIDLPDLAVLYMEAKETFAKVFRGGFLISTWAVFESCIKDVGEHVRLKRDLPFGLQDLRAGDFLNQSEKFFRSTLDIAFIPDKGDRKQLELLRNLRNLLAHHDGSIGEAPAELLRATGVVTRVTDYHHDYVTPTSQYNQQSLELVARIAESLADSVYSILKR